MKPPCEIIVSRVIPQIRAAIVSALITEHKMTQTEISKKLGITQASVSQYLSYARGRDKAVLELFPEIQTRALKIAKYISEEKAKKSDVLHLVCELCGDLRKTPKFCRYHRTFAQLEKCKICF